jgi:hypothetical protein
MLHDAEWGRRSQSPAPSRRTRRGMARGVSYMDLVAPRRLWVRRLGPPRDVAQLSHQAIL